MADFKHGEMGVLVSIADGKNLGPDWDPVADDAPKARTPRNKKVDDKSE